MTGSRRLAAAFTIAAAVAVTTLGPAGAQAAAAAVAEVGWWTRNPAATAPADGFAVGRAPDGAVSVAAVGVTGGGNVRRAVLLLRETGGVATDRATLQVCATPNAWKAGGAQPWGEAPKPECTFASVTATRHPATSTWSADVTNLLARLEDTGRVGIMVVPAAEGSVPLFDVQFGKPDLQVEALDADTTPSPSGAAPGPASGSGSDGGFGGASAERGGDDAAFDSGAGAPLATAPGGLDPAATPAAPTAAGDPPAAAGDGVPAELAALPTQAAAGVGTGGGRSVTQAVFFLAVAAVAGVAAGAGRWFLRQRSTEDAFA